MLFRKDKKDEPDDIREKVRDASRESTPERVSHLRERGPEEPGRPGAVNLERDEPITDAARRRDVPARDMPAGDAYAGEEVGRDFASELETGRGSGASETTNLKGGRNLQGTSAVSVPQDRVGGVPGRDEEENS